MALETRIQMLYSETTTNTPGTTLLRGEVGVNLTDSRMWMGKGNGNTPDEIGIFKTIAVSGQSDVIADKYLDTLTLVAGSNITITTDAGTDSVTIASGTGVSDLDGLSDVTITGGAAGHMLVRDGAGQYNNVPLDVTLTGDVTGTASVDANGDVSVTTTVANDSHTHTEANISDLGTTILLHTDVDDVPVDAATDVPISSNWAYDHITSASVADPHSDQGYAQVGSTETITSVWTFNTLPESSSDPTTANQFTRKGYVDSKLQGLDTKASCRFATTASINLATNGLTAVDGTALSSGDRILVKNQSTASENGIYVAAVGAWSRATDMDGAWNDEVVAAYVWVEEGTANADTGWVVTSDAGGTLGTTNMTWAIFANAQNLSAGDGLTKNGSVIDLDLSALGTAFSDAVPLATGDLFAVENVSAGATEYLTFAQLEDSIAFANMANSGTLAVGKGGTGLSTISVGQILYASGADTLAALTSPAAVGYMLRASAANTFAWTDTISGGTF